MIVIGSILVIVLIGAYIFLGMKISESIVQNDVKLFFWALYTTTLFTLINISISIFFYSSLYNKKGPLGPRGIKGKLGDAGDSGSCGGGSCKVKTVQIMIEEAIQNIKNENDITPDERKLICNIVNSEISFGSSAPQQNNKANIQGWDLQKLKAFYEYLNNADNYQTNINNYSIDQRINRQNNGSDNLDWLKTLIRTASQEGSGNSIDPDKTSTECV